jgi:hypothetical protein
VPLVAPAVVRAVVYLVTASGWAGNGLGVAAEGTPLPEVVARPAGVPVRFGGQSPTTTPAPASAPATASDAVPTVHRSAFRRLIVPRGRGGPLGSTMQLHPLWHFADLIMTALPLLSWKTRGTAWLSQTGDKM